MIISFSGVQSSGKTTLLKACKEIYSDRFEFVDEVTRLVKREFNIEINERGNDITQCLIVNKHIENLMRRRENNGVILDRCILDGLCYTRYLRNKGNVSRWVYEYTEQIYFELIGRYDVIFYTDPSDVELIDDGERSIDIEFRNTMIELFERILKYDEILASKVVRLKGTVEQRMEAIKINLQ